MKVGLTPQQAGLLEMVTATRRLAQVGRPPACFLGVCISNATRIRTLLSPELTQNAGRKVSVLVQEHFPGMTFKWLDEGYGLGFLAGQEENEFRENTTDLANQCQLHLTLGTETYSITTRVMGTWFSVELEASPRFLLDTAEHLLRRPRTDGGYDFVVIHTQEDAIDVLGRCVDLLSDLGLSQKGSRTDRRLRKRITLKTPCLVRYFLAGTTDMDQMTGETFDVSQGGFGLFVPRELRAGEVVELELRKDKGSLFVASKVCHCRYVSVRRYAIGVAALHTSEGPIISSNPAQAFQSFGWLSEYLRSRAAWSR